MRKEPLLIEVAIEPRRRADQAKLVAALVQIAVEDDGFRFGVDRESGQIVMSLTSEPRLGIIAGRLWREFGVEANIGAPQVAYRETISRMAEVDYTLKKQAGGSGEYARVKLRLEPLRGSEVAFENAAAGVPREYVPGVEQGARAALQQGALAGFPVIGVKVTLMDGARHAVDSSVSAFETAARSAVKEGLTKTAPKLLEPIMRVDVVTPEKYEDRVIADLNNRRGSVVARGERGIAEVISAMVPLANLFGYAEDLVRMTSGEATFTMRFRRYKPVPPPSGDPPFRPAIGMRA